MAFWLPMVRMLHSHTHMGIELEMGTENQNCHLQIFLTITKELSIVSIRKHMKIGMEEWNSTSLYIYDA